jgi:hypothetical protein
MEIPLILTLLFDKQTKYLLISQDYYLTKGYSDLLET